MKQKPLPVPDVPSTTNLPATVPGLPVGSGDPPVPRPSALRWRRNPPPRWGAPPARWLQGHRCHPRSSPGTAAATTPSPHGSWFPIRWHPFCEGEEEPGEEGFPSMHRGGQVGFGLALPPGTAAVQAAAVPARARLPSRFMVPRPRRRGGTRCSASDAAARSCRKGHPAVNHREHQIK